MPLNHVDASSPSDCWCNPGYAQRTEAERLTNAKIVDNECHACTAGFFNEESNSVQCSACGAGYYSATEISDSEDNCLPCEANTFSGTGESTCRACTSNSQAPPQSRVFDSCICNVGFTGANGGPYIACDTGKYKIASGNESCAACLEGQYSTAVGASSDSTCQQCPLNSNAAEASDETPDCICNAGSAGPSAGPCFLCVAGKYAIGSGNALCTSCVAGKYLLFDGAVADTCVQCPLNSHSEVASGAREDCFCNAGSTGPGGGPCDLCVAGTYKNVTGSAQCTNCDKGLYSVQDGQTSSETCVQCPLRSNALAGSDEKIDCTCNAGSTGPNGTVCEQCVAGKYKSEQGNSACSSCRAGQYLPEIGAIDDVCRDCLSNSNSAESSVRLADCNCNAGSTGNDGTACELRVAGKYKVTTGDAACTSCLRGQYSTDVGAVDNVCAA